MKPAIPLLLALALATPQGASAQSDAMKGMDMKGMDMKDKDRKTQKSSKGQPQSHKGSGTVTSVNKVDGKVTIAHGAIPSMKWPAMSMTFRVRDKALLDRLATGQKVEFEFTQQGKDYVIGSAK